MLWRLTRFPAPLRMLYRFGKRGVLAKIAVKSSPASADQVHDHGTGALCSRVIAEGGAWRVRDVICRAGPRDRAFEEQHTKPSIAIVVAGTFQYRSHAGRELMTPGSLLLGNAGQCFECGHEHGVGDRCLSFEYEPEYFESVIAETGRNRAPVFSSLRVPPVRELSSVIARALVMAAADEVSDQHSRLLGDKEGEDVSSGTVLWEEIALELVGRSVALAGAASPSRNSPPSAEARVTRVLRMLERYPDMPHTLTSLAREARLSRYHFLRMFCQLAGLTPHQYIIRSRLRRAAVRLIAEPSQVLNIALESGFGDVSNFNHAFRSEFGVSPSSYRKLGSANALRL